MSNSHEVISAFLDDEPFDPSQLAQTLGEPDGRALLLDLLALRHVVQPGQEATTLQPQRGWSLPQAFVAAAAVVVALVGGYLVGERRAGVTDATAPAATRVVDAPAAWQELP